MVDAVGTVVGINDGAGQDLELAAEREAKSATPGPVGAKAKALAPRHSANFSPLSRCRFQKAVRSPPTSASARST
ncbi:hypothetical protein [Mesorhizobium sp. M0118]|uniref:hypothetical protein n=1 Tax=Mesorhizobium sp. M0118 TaxID=2956884 RepID=UPI003339BE6B